MVGSFGCESFACCFFEWACVFDVGCFGSFFLLLFLDFVGVFFCFFLVCFGVWFCGVLLVFLVALVVVFGPVGLGGVLGAVSVFWLLGLVLQCIFGWFWVVLLSFVWRVVWGVLWRGVFGWFWGWFGLTCGGIVGSGFGRSKLRGFVVLFGGFVGCVFFIFIF